MIFRPRLIRILLGWDGLGVTSYLLVNYYASEKSYNARILTAITNRIGDTLIISAVRISIPNFFLNYRIVRTIRVYSSLVLILLILAAFTKSAQIPFSAWLPAAIAAPTPVSSLVHSSTLVTAGVYLLIRFNNLIRIIRLLNFCIIGGIITILISGISATIEIDIKKVIALSTLRQLGVIIFRLGLGQTIIRFFHLICHAYFKAIIFITAGIIIHRIKDYQDIRKIGVSFNTPVLSTLFFISSIRLCGIPFITGFYSKDLILERMIIQPMPVFVIFLVMLSTRFTVIYRSRVLLLLFINLRRQDVINCRVDISGQIIIGALILIVPRVIGGYFFSGVLPIIQPSVVPTLIKLEILLVILLSAFLSLFIGNYIKPSKQLSGFYIIWFLPTMIRRNLSIATLSLSRVMLNSNEISWLDYLMGGVFKNLNKRVFMAIRLSSGLLSRVVILLVCIILF